ncbi:MAG: BREX system P-loop protein BrxC [Verrucomicrobiae bacterium]|nr:BREX system P-loop protein BrxC [Verrucomicrobiae bacterium]NNJ42136.1 BREX system P-loop protein BrxC [Akkermansiaceae bacterium]
MATIKSLFDDNLTFERRVEKVITFSNREENILRNEARDYVLTDNLSSEYEKLLNFFDDAQSGDGAPECCTWLSGFYGSGKSSFAKYFGLCFDPHCTVENTPFHELFTARFESKTLQQRIKTLTKKYNTSVFLLDLAAQGRSGSNNTPISTLLFDHVCAWADYPSDAKLQELCALLDLNDQLDDFKQKCTDNTGLDYKDLVNQPTILIPTASLLAHEYYPKIWQTPESFMAAQSISTTNDQEKVKQMLDLIQKKTESRRVLFIIDEVGHFLRNNQSLISNLDGLARNLKEIGEGRAWMIATAQQTIPKTGPLFGLQDRFPIKIDLKASDIREITHKRLLKKSVNGTSQLKKSFGEHGQKLIHSTKLSGKGCETYPKLTDASFVDFYPLLPQQFELLIEAISALAKLHGGVGLRSAIRCVEEILISNHHGGQALIEDEFGSLITAGDIYSVLHKDIVSAAREITLHVDAVASKYGEHSMEHQVAMTIAVLQQIDGFPASRENVAALLHPHIDSQPLLDTTNKAIDTLISNPLIPVGEADHMLSFLSEVVSQIEQDRATLLATSTHRDAVQSHVLKELFSRPPKALIDETKTIDSGIALFDGKREQDVIGGDKDIRFLLQLSKDSDIAETKNSLTQESLGSQNKAKIYLCAIQPPSIREALEEVYRAEEIRRMHQNHSDQDVIRYLDGQQQLAIQKRLEIKQAIKEALSAGWFIFRGQAIAVENLGSSLESATKKKLASVAEEVFEHYSKAAFNVPGKVAEAFLKTRDLTQINRDRDPLELVEIKGSDTEINLNHPALMAVMEFFQRHPNPDGKRILTEFSNPPYGWTKDTTRYLLAALFYAQKIKLKVNGNDLTVIGSQSFEAFKNNSSFNNVTVNPNHDEEPDGVRQAAAKRLSDLTDEQVIALPQRIAEIASKYLPKFQSEVQGLPIKVQPLGIDTDRLSRLQRSLTEALMGDGAGATLLFGADESEIYDDLIWARDLKKALNPGTVELLKELTALDQQVAGLNQQGQLTELQDIWSQKSSDPLKRVKDGSFVNDIPDLSLKVEELKGLVNEHCNSYATEKKSQVQDQIDALLGSQEYRSLDEQEQESFQVMAEDVLPYLDATISGIQSAPNQIVSSLAQLHKVRTQVQAAAQPPKPPEPPEQPKPGTVSKKITTTLNSTDDLDKLISELQTLRDQLEEGKSITLISDH